MILRTLMSNREDFLRNITHIIIDEFHERVRFSDLLLILKQYLTTNPFIRLILMSETFNITFASECNPNDSPENIDQKGEEEVIENCVLTRAYSRSLSRTRHSEKGHICGGPSRPSLISHHMAFGSDTDYDRVDALPDHMTFTILDALAILFSIGSFLFDIGTDIAVAAFHYINQDFWYESNLEFNWMSTDFSLITHKH